MNKVAITGVGAYTSVGKSVEENFRGFLDGVQGNTPLKHLAANSYSAKHAYEIEDEVAPNNKYRSTKFLVAALEEALNQAGLPRDSDVPVFIGTGLRELRTVEIADAGGERMDLADLDYRRAVNSILPNSKSVFTINNACAASNYAISMAFDRIAYGDSNIAVVGGCDTLTASMFGLLDRATPETPSVVQVFDENRKGVLMGEGGVAIVMENFETAIDAGRRPLAIVNGIGLSTDGVHETAPDQISIERAMNDAYECSDVKPADIDLVYVHGTGTSLNDATECKAMNEIFKESDVGPPICGIKAMTGHTSGASGGIGVVASVKSLEEQVIPPTPGTTRPLEYANKFPLFEKKVKQSIQTIQVNAFGFGGVNSVVLVSRANEIQS